VRSNGPHVSRRIHHPSNAVAPKLIRHWKQYLRPAGNSPFHRLVHVFNLYIDHHRRTAVQAGSAARQSRPLCLEHDHRRADHHQSMRHSSVWTPVGARALPRQRCSCRNQFQPQRRGKTTSGLPPRRRPVCPSPHRPLCPPSESRFYRSLQNCESHSRHRSKVRPAP
jgi:hypothetical protein